MKELIEYPYFLTPKECKTVIDILNTSYVPGTGIRQNPTMASELLKIIKPKLPYFKFTNYISTGNTKEAVGKHTDPKLDNKVTHKLLIYLNELSLGGGTFFDGNIYIKPAIGKAVVFDITMPHWGEGFPKGEMKRVLGLRMYKEA